MTDVTSTNFTITAPTARPAMADTGSEGGLPGQLPGKMEFTVEEAKNATNPLQYVPVVGTIYRLVTGENIPAPLSILSSIASGAAFGGPIGVVGSIALNFIQEMIHLGPDTSRPPVPLGMQTGSAESGVQMPLPGEVAPKDSYTTLATVLPDFLGGGSNTAYAGGDQPAGAEGDQPAGVGSDQPPGQVRQALAAYSQATWTG